MKIAYICHHKRPNYEYAWFAAMPVETVRFITTEDTAPSDDPKIEHRKVSFEEKGWENNFFSSTAKRVFYQDFEKHLEDIDVVVVLEVFSSLSKQFVEYCNKVNKPVVVLVYELIAEHPIYKIPRYSGNTKYVLKHADHFVNVSHMAAEHTRTLGAPEAKNSVVYPGIDLNIFKPNTAQQQPLSLMFVGKLEPHKGIDQVLSMYPLLENDFHSLPLTIVGAGSWKPQVEALAQKFPSVTYYERIPNHELPGYLTTQGVYILPARDTHRLGMRIGAEQFGFTIVEAMACGLACVTTDCGALAEIATDNNVICAQNDTDDLYLKTKALLQDTARVSTIGATNVTIVQERYDLTKQAAAFADVLAEVQHSRHG
jgi:glycosyltransferase involved in cell wall biosynthesis